MVIMDSVFEGNVGMDVSGLMVLKLTLKEVVEDDSLSKQNLIHTGSRSYG